LKNNLVDTKTCALNWILILHDKLSENLHGEIDQLFPVLYRNLSFYDESVVRLDIKVLALLSNNESYFMKLMNELVIFLRGEEFLLKDKGILIIRLLCSYLNPESVFKALALILENEENTDFSYNMIHILNIILITSYELIPVKNKLKSLKFNDSESLNLFIILYRSWCHNPGAVFNLCLLSQVYEHAFNLLYRFSTLILPSYKISDLESLVYILESPYSCTLDYN